MNTHLYEISQYGEKGGGQFEPTRVGVTPVERGLKVKLSFVLGYMKDVREI
jgi:hypothetical protein